MERTMKKIVALALAVLAMGCTPRPEDIAPLDVGDRYRGVSCNTLSREYRKWSMENARASTYQAAANVSLIPMVLEREDEVAEAKGHLQAIEHEQNRRDCPA